MRAQGWFDPGAHAISPLEQRGTYEEQRRARHAAEARSPLLVKCAYIQDTLLRRADPQLHASLAEKEV